MRSIWKPYVLKNACCRSSFLDRLQQFSAMRTQVKGTRLFKLFNEKSIWVYNGKDFREIFILNEFNGHFLGSFVFSKQGTMFIHRKTVKKKRGRVNKNKKKK